MQWWLTSCSHLQDILAAAEGDVASAAWALSEIQGPVTPSRSPLTSPHISPRRPGTISPGPGSRAASVGSRAASPAPTLLHASAHAQCNSSGRHPGKPQLGQKAGAELSPARNRQSQAHPEVEALQRLSVAKNTEDSRYRGLPRPGGAASARDEDEQDVYYSYRADALQLTRQWQKAAQKAAAAYSG